MSKLNNKGQTLTLFVIFVPVIIMIGIVMTDISYAKYQERKLDNINKEVVKYGLKHINEDPYEEMVNLIYKNDSDVDSYDISIDENKIRVELKRSSSSFFGKIIGKDIFNEQSIFNGTIEEDKISIKKGDEN